MEPQSSIGMVGLGVMGRNLALNFADHGHKVAVYDRNEDLLNAFDANAATVCQSPESLCAALPSPRCIMMMVTAGDAVDWCIDSLLPHLDKGDTLIDGGNSHYKDTMRRAKRLEAEGFGFIGTGVSGGEEGARRGPALMPGGTESSWQTVGPILESIAARVDNNTPCCAYIGPNGAGHFVKMVHNGIEYADMQLICEAYWLMTHVLGATPEELSAVFAKWNEGILESYLIEITSHILSQSDPKTGQPMVDVILDTAGQKGTGKWTSQAALDYGTASPTIAEAVFARCLSALKEQRTEASTILDGPTPSFDGDRTAFIEEVERALYASKICAYAQGFRLLHDASREYDWDLDFARIAKLWRGGCIIRAAFLDRIADVYETDAECSNLLLTPYFRNSIDRAQAAWRHVATTAIDNGIPIPAFSSALAYYDGYRSATLPANLLQAQRDYFGAHTYERNDAPRGEFFHTQWGEEA